jgi:DNA-binding NtrC family response regulator
MAATSRDIDGLVKEGKFRSDLLYRLSVVRLQVPSLRERREDIPDLVWSYIEHLKNNLSCDVTGIREDAMRAMVAYEWPGNVRELINVIERAMLLSEDAEIDLEDLPEEISAKAKKKAPSRKPSASFNGNLSFPEDWLDLPLHEVRDELYAEFERIYLTTLLEKTGGQINESAKRAGITPRALFDKMQRRQLKKESFKPRKADK